MRRALSLLPPLLLFLGLAFSEACFAQELGRLFFTPEQRKALDARRKARVPDKPAAAAVVVSPTMRLDGYVKRSGARSTVWVNGESVDDKPPAGGSDARVPVTVGEGAGRIGLKPGETLDRGNGEVRGGLGEGQIQIRRR
jgi:hypothetical protein